MKLLKRIPGMKTAFFSILGPHKHVPAHRGPFKGVLRLLLAPRIPEPAEKCGIRVGTHTRTWDEGKALVFDDTVRHEVWNHTDGVRVVLFVDVVRPMRFPANCSKLSRPLSRRTKKQRCLKTRCGKTGMPTKLLSPFASRVI